MRSTVACRSAPTKTRTGGCTDQASVVEVPAGVGQHLLAAGGQAGEVRHRAAGDEADVGAGRQPEQLEQPARGGLLGGHDARRREAQSAVLVPGADHPVGGQRRGERPADDPAVEPPGPHRHQARLDGLGEQVDHLTRGYGASGQLAAHPVREGLDVPARRDGTLPDVREPAAGVVVGTFERDDVRLRADGHSPTLHRLIPPAPSALEEARAVPYAAQAFQRGPPPSSSGPGHRPFTAVARVRIPLGVRQFGLAAHHEAP